jgi:hypothetical protein
VLGTNVSGVLGVKLIGRPEDRPTFEQVHVSLSALYKTTALEEVEVRQSLRDSGTYQLTKSANYENIIK